MEELVIKEGFCSRLHASIEKECGDKFYTYEVLLSERTGDSHGSIVLVCGRHVVEKTEYGYTIWFMNSEEAEPYSSYKHVNHMLSDLAKFETIEDIHFKLSESFKDKYLPLACDPTVTMPWGVDW